MTTTSATSSLVSALGGGSGIEADGKAGTGGGGGFGIRSRPAGALVSAKGDIFYVSGRTGKYLEPAAGKANWNLFAMAREGLRYEIAGAFQKALRQKESVALHGLTIGTNGGEQCVNVTVQRLDDPTAPLERLYRFLPIVEDGAVQARTVTRPELVTHALLPLSPVG